MLIVALIAAALGLGGMMSWLFRTPVAYTPQRLVVAVSADLTLMLIIVIILYGIGVRLVWQ